MTMLAFSFPEWFQKWFYQFWRMVQNHISDWFQPFASQWNALIDLAQNLCYLLAAIMVVFAVMQLVGSGNPLLYLVLMGGLLVLAAALGSLKIPPPRPTRTEPTRIIPPPHRPEPTRIIALEGNLAFGVVKVKTTSEPKTMKIINSGNSEMIVSRIDFPEGFRGDPTAPPDMPIPANGGSRSVTVTFSPTEKKTYGGILMAQNYSGRMVQVISNKTSGIDTAPISGMGNATRIIEVSGNLEFGNVAVNEMRPLNIEIRNVGDETLEVSEFNGFPREFTYYPSPPFTILKKAKKDVTVRFKPTAEQTYSFTVKVVSDKTIGTDTITASGAGLERTRIISVSKVEFGDVAVNTTKNATMTIFNSGNSEMMVNRINYPNEFNVYLEGFSGNWTHGPIPARGKQDVTVTFHPTEEKAYGWNVKVDSNSTSGIYIGLISGMGVVGTPTHSSSSPTGATKPRFAAVKISGNASAVIVRLFDNKKREWLDEKTHKVKPEPDLGERIEVDGVQAVYVGTQAPDHESSRDENAPPSQQRPAVVEQAPPARRQYIMSEQECFDQIAATHDFNDGMAADAGRGDEASVRRKTAELAKKFPNSPMTLYWQMMLAFLDENPDKATGIYNKFMTQYPPNEKLQKPFKETYESSIIKFKKPAR